jgi:dolichyl-phosphate beta-glucosyltransferase
MLIAPISKTHISEECTIIKFTHGPRRWISIRTNSDRRGRDFVCQGPAVPTLRNGMQMSRLSLTVVIPAYNESHRLPGTLAAIRPYLDSRFASYEVIVVDDGSKDATPAVVEALRGTWPNLILLRQPRNMGKGAAVRRGCLAANCDVVLFMDADLATPIEEFDLMLPLFTRGEYRAVVGVRTYQEHESKWRRVVGLILQLMAHLIVFEKAVIDSQCGF